MAAFGFLLAMVGLDPQSSIQRFTFGHLYLWEGINVVPVVVGLFGGAEVLQLMMTKGSIARATGQTGRLPGSCRACATRSSTGRSRSAQARSAWESA